jgi:hypothetical protein
MSQCMSSTSNRKCSIFPKFFREPSWYLAVKYWNVTAQHYKNPRVKFSWCHDLFLVKVLHIYYRHLYLCSAMLQRRDPWHVYQTIFFDGGGWNFSRFRRVCKIGKSDY